MTSSIRSASAMKSYLPTFLLGMVLSMSTMKGATAESGNNWSERSPSLGHKRSGTAATASGSKCIGLLVARGKERAPEPTEGGKPGDRGLVLSIQLACGPEGCEDLSHFLESIPVTCWIWKTRATSRTPSYWLLTLSTTSPGHPAPLCGR